MDDQKIDNDDQKIGIVNLYAPNTHQRVFYKNLIQELSKLEYDNWCVLGDYNAMVNQDKNKK